MFHLPKDIQILIFEYEYNLNRQHFKNVIIPNLKYCLVGARYYMYSHISYNNLRYKVILNNYYEFIKDVKEYCRLDYYKLRYNEIMQHLRNYQKIMN